MTDNELTNEQIIKALELCLDKGDCKECLCYGGACITDNDVLACLKRQQAEIEQLRQLFVESGKEQDRLMAEVERLEEDKDNLIKTYAECMTEAIKEFAFQLKILLETKAILYSLGDRDCDFAINQATALKTVDNLVKDMTE